MIIPRNIKLFYKLCKNENSAKSRIIGYKSMKIEANRLRMGIQAIKRYSNFVALKQQKMERMAVVVNRVINRSNQVYTVFYEMKTNTKKNIGSIL